ncbi:MAG: BMP family ABC transporter substrate-binding protein [Phototrophicales bacterium]|nr:BMP family ABC transporter substrate-binding protein [Phototrophicales bacterium]
MIRKGLLAVLAFLMIGVSVSTAQEEDTSTRRVCMVLNIGIVEDGGFNQNSWDGLLAIAGDYDLTVGEDVIYLASDSDEDWLPNIQECAESYDVVVTVGFQLAELTAQVALDYPDKFFVGVDHDVVNGSPNYVGVQFSDDEAGFLAGYLAVLVTETNVIGGVFGPPIPVIKRFRNGFMQGADYAITQLEITDEITILTEYASSFAAPEEGIALVDGFIEAGADVIFGAAGLTGSEGIKHAAAQGIYVIGVDQDEYFTTFQSGTVEGADRLITSMLKRVNVGVYDMVAALIDGDMASFPGGRNYILSLANDGISFAPEHDADIPLEYYDAIIDVADMLAFGDISTGVERTTGSVPSLLVIDIADLEGVWGNEQGNVAFEGDTWRIFGEGFELTGTFTLEGNVITLAGDNEGDGVSIEIYALDETTLIVQSSNQSTTETFTRSE